MLVELLGLPSLVNLISKDAIWYSINQFTLSFTLQTSDYDVIIKFCGESASWHHHSKRAASSRPDKDTCREMANI